MPENGSRKANENQTTNENQPVLKHLHLRRLERTLAQIAARRGMGVSFHTEGRIWVSETKSTQAGWTQDDCDPREVLGL